MSKGKNKTFLKRKRTLQTFKSSVEYNEMYYLNVKSAICHLSLKSIPHFAQPNNSNWRKLCLVTVHPSDIVPDCTPTCLYCSTNQHRPRQIMTDELLIPCTMSRLNNDDQTFTHLFEQVSLSSAYPDQEFVNKVTRFRGAFVKFREKLILA